MHEIEFSVMNNGSANSSIETKVSKTQDGNDVAETTLSHENIAISYSFAEEQFQQEQAALSYTPLKYAKEEQELFSFNAEDDYWSAAAVEDTDSETMTTEEAEGTVIDIQYATVLGSAGELDHTERRKLAVWAAFNITYLNLFHSLYALTGDVNYSKTV